MGQRDSEVVFVLTGTGPEYWKDSDPRIQDAKLFQHKQYYTVEFANVFARFLLQNGGVCAQAMRATRLPFEESGCQVTQLTRRNTAAMAMLACDIMQSGAFMQLRNTNLKTLGRHQEFRSVSIDATHKLSLKVMGQRRTHGHNWVSVVGFRGSPIALTESRGEGVQVLTAVLKQAVPEAYRAQVVNVSSDVCNGKLYTSIKNIFPNLKYLSLDPMHLCFRVDSHTKKSGVKPTVVGLVMRSIMRKFSIAGKKSSESPYVGQTSARLSSDEQNAVNQIKAGDMPMKTAKGMLTSMDPNTPMVSLKEFALLLAAVVKVYPERMDSKFDKTTLRASLVNAASHERFGWYLNNVQYRSSLSKGLEEYLGVGTTRNEQLHAKLNSSFRNTVRISKRALAAEAGCWLTAEMALFARALSKKTTRRMSRADMLPLVFSKMKVFTPALWQDFIQHAPEAWVPEKTKTTSSERKRKGPSLEQEQVYAAIRAKTADRKRRRIF